MQQQQMPPQVPAQQQPQRQQQLQAAQRVATGQSRRPSTYPGMSWIGEDTPAF